MIPSNTQNAPVLTVSQLTNAIKLSLESTFPTVCLQGEISNFKLQSSGHLYFSLKDAQAQISVVMFRADALALNVMPKGGDQVIVKGEVNVYPAKGNYQLVIRELSYVGLGELLQKLELLKVKLHQLGWFKSTRKKQLPRFPKRIGVVTSPTGAVIQDILNVLSRRFSGFHLILNPVKVQGEGAAQEIAQAIDYFNKYALVDVMIVGRGGGSIEDLWAFNEEIVAQAIYNSQIPVISAVGHETDHCIADYVADVRAPTPSAAAEIVIAEKAQQLENIKGIKKRLQQTVMHLAQKTRYRLDGILKHPLFVRPTMILEERMQRLDDYKLSLEQSMQQFLQLKRHQIEVRAKQSLALKPTTQIAHFKQKLIYWERSLNQILNQRLSHHRTFLIQRESHLNQLWVAKQNHRRHLFDKDRLHKRLDQLIQQRMTIYHDKLKHMASTLQAVDPKNLLNNGYSILFAENDRSVIKSIKQLKKDQKGSLWLSDGEATITINEIRPFV
ncbi:MAG: exodeoxyribonuclease VII large subunit [Parachlamydiaceae bacterium]|nr:exodeoxyribonuclease VII large subunit [Parachlamydiaceae bacterium]